MVTVDLSDIFSAADRLDSNAENIKKKIEAIEDYGQIPKDIPKSNIVKQARLSVAIDNPLECDGGIGVCNIPKLQDLLDYLCQNGFEHYVAMDRSLCMDILAEALEKYLGWEVYCHE